MNTRFALLAGLALAACDRGGDTPPGTPAAAATDPVAATAPSHAHDAPLPSSGAAEPPTVALFEQQVAYGEAASRNLVGFLAMPADAAEPLPGVLVIHEWWGLNDDIKTMTRQIAAQGYVALAVDLFGGEVTGDRARAQALMAAVLADPDAVRDNLRQAYTHLDQYAFAPRIGVLGRSLGGGVALQAALTLPSEIDAVVMYYGQIVTERERLAPLAMPILGHFAELDPSIPVRDIHLFRTTLTQLGKNAQILIHSDVDHAFASPSDTAYNAAAAADAWTTTLGFLAEHLR
jgi:carboxymethylenebutenolidase